MVKVIRAFRERYQDMRLYNIGDTYQVNDEKRVEYLVSQGFLEMTNEAYPASPEKLRLEEFADLSAVDQKKLLASLGIHGDDSNVQKREELYKQYLDSEAAELAGSENDGDVDSNVDSDT
ncbi:hypothetical protein [Brevibacillus borstelensis]|uniref:hypothetical protein n=1 Tax=Brevibacillus borstelensis TaxID=45462 RepID=UPI00056B29E2|nr:hypothetical protein [Brevibacillus borstelensis]KKX56349.1 hypothetical protein X546_04485 [Brevibacillus borstelensis cifa_chp40]